MKQFTVFLIGISILITHSDLSAQAAPGQKVIFPDGVSLEYGIGSYAHTDAYISKEKYSGGLPYFKAGFTHDHETYVYRIGIAFRSGSDIKNHSVRADVYQFALNQEFLYPLPEFTLFSKKTYMYIGPSAEVFLYSNRQHIAVSGFDYAQSFAGLISLGLSSQLMYPLSPKVVIESGLDFSVLSLGLRMVDMEETDESPVKLLTSFSGVNMTFLSGMRYYLFDNFSVKASYLSGVTRITSWEPLHAASDTVIFTITYGF